MNENTNSSSFSEEAPAKFCTRCGRRLALDAAYCDGCGHAQNAKSAPEQMSFAQNKSYLPEKISDIVGKERPFYNRSFTELRETGSHVCWNWYACLGWYWYAYRKMPVEAALCFAAYLILGEIHPFGFLLQLGLLAASGALGNYIYLRHIERTIDRIDALPPAMRENAVREYGGVSGVLLIAAFAISVIAFGGIKLSSFWYANPPFFLQRYLHSLFGH